MFLNKKIKTLYKWLQNIVDIETKCWIIFWRFKSFFVLLFRDYQIKTPM